MCVATGFASVAGRAINNLHCQILNLACSSPPYRFVVKLTPAETFHRLGCSRGRCRSRRRSRGWCWEAAASALSAAEDTRMPAESGEVTDSLCIFGFSPPAGTRGSGHRHNWLSQVFRISRSDASRAVIWSSTVQTDSRASCGECSASLTSSGHKIPPLEKKAWALAQITGCPQKLPE